MTLSLRGFLEEKLDKEVAEALQGVSKSPSEQAYSAPRSVPPRPLHSSRLDSVPCLYLASCSVHLYLSSANLPFHVPCRPRIRW